MAGIWLEHFLVITTIGVLLQVSLCDDCLDKYQCVPFSQCHVGRSDNILYPCDNGVTMVCCPPGSYNINATNSSATLTTRESSVFPENCGTVMTSDKITGGKKADLGQFPWMALLGYRQKRIDYTQFLCGGSILTQTYVLTAGHCINLDRRLELVLVRLGEHDLLTPKDCVKFKDSDEICADSHIDIPIDRIIVHPNFDNQKLKNDIALIKIRRKLHFTDYIKPICLPFGKNLDKKNLAKQKLIVSGWGKTDAANLGGSTSLQFTSVTVWNDTACKKYVPPEVKPIQSTQLCANGATKEDACKGDSGGPLVNATVDKTGDLRYFQIGIVSFASSLTCGDPNLPTVYTRIDKFLKWIMENVS